MAHERARDASWFASFGLATARFIAGGAFLLAAFMKLKGPDAFMLSMNSFGFIPVAAIPFLAYLIPWVELIVGLLLIYGLWGRPAGIISAGLYVAFSIALMIVILSGKSLDCGCFGALFGKGTIGWHSLGRNAVFIVAAAAVALWGAGGASLDAVLARRAADTARPIET